MWTQNKKQVPLDSRQVTNKQQANKTSLVDNINSFNNSPQKEDTKNRTAEDSEDSMRTRESEADLNTRKGRAKTMGHRGQEQNTANIEKQPNNQNWIKCI